MVNRKYDAICPKCGRASHITKTWTRNKNKKKFYYNIYFHKDGSKHYIRVNNNNEKPFITTSVYDLLKSIIKKLDLTKGWRYGELKRITEINIGRRINNETFARALKRLQIDGLLQKNYNGSKILYMRKIIPESRYLTISRLDITLKILDDELICQFLFNLENVYDDSFEEFFLHGNIGIDSLFQVDQISSIFDKWGSIPLENVTPFVSYGDNIMISIKLNSIIKKDEKSYLFMRMKLDKKLGHLRIRSWSIAKEVNVTVIYELTNNETFNIKVNRQLGLGIFEEIPVYRKKTYNKLVFIDAVLGNLEASEGLYIKIK